MWGGGSPPRACGYRRSSLPQRATNTAVVCPQFKTPPLTPAKTSGKTRRVNRCQINFRAPSNPSRCFRFGNSLSSFFLLLPQSISASPFGKTGDSASAKPASQSQALTLSLISVVYSDRSDCTGELSNQGQRCSGGPRLGGMWRSSLCSSVMEMFT